MLGDLNLRLLQDFLELLSAPWTWFKSIKVSAIPHGFAFCICNEGHEIATTAILSPLRLPLNSAKSSGSNARHLSNRLIPHQLLPKGKLGRRYEAGCILLITFLGFWLEVEPSDVTACLTYPASSVFLRRVFGSADHSGADRTSDRAGAAQE